MQMAFRIAPGPASRASGHRQRSAEATERRSLKKAERGYGPLAKQLAHGRSSGSQEPWFSGPGGRSSGSQQHWQEGGRSSGSQQHWQAGGPIQRLSAALAGFVVGLLPVAVLAELIGGGPAQTAHPPSSCAARKKEKGLQTERPEPDTNRH